MNLDQLNAVFAGQNHFQIEPLNKNGYSINNNQNGIYFFYFSEKNSDVLYLFSLLSTAENLSEEQKKVFYKKLLQLNLPTSSKNFVKLGMTENNEIFLSTILDASTLTSDILKQKLSSFLTEVQIFRTKLIDITEHTDNTKISDPKNISPEFAFGNFIRI